MPLPLRACPREGDDAGSSNRAAELGGSEGSDGGSISINQILSLKERFDRADTDGGGSLDEHEFMEAFGCIINKDGSMTGSKRPLVFSQCMRSGSTSPPSTGYLSFARRGKSPGLALTRHARLVFWCSLMCADEQIKRLFMQIDANSDGGIDWFDLPCDCHLC
ncbi:MAG: hypothetical protein ACPIOQ_76765 [Promethearchaeia archaeon]